MGKRRESKKLVAQEPDWDTFPRINPDAAGMDIGEAEIMACVPKGRAERPIRGFATFTPDLQSLVEWLQSCGIKTVAMECTGVYWVPVYEMLEAAGLTVYVVNARHIKNVPGRKSDASDAEWIQLLHSYGLLASSFLLEATWRPLRVYWRHRMTLVEHRAPHIQHMQKALQLMNLQLPQVLSDITGTTGLQIIRAIVAGEHDPVKLAQLRHPCCANSSETIAKALTGHYQAEHIFALKQSLELYNDYTQKIAECDAEMQRAYTVMQNASGSSGDSLPPLKPDWKKGTNSKNAPAFNARECLYRAVGVDLTEITGLNESTVQTIISEIGTDMSRWPSAKHFCSWLGLAPHNDVSGGKRLRSRTLQQHNRASQALRMSAQAAGRTKTAIGAYYRRLAVRIGKEQAIVATAHKIARIIYAMLTKGVSFNDVGADEYERLYQARRFASLRKNAHDLGYELVPIQGRTEAVCLA